MPVSDNNFLIKFQQDILYCKEHIIPRLHLEVKAGAELFKNA